LPRECTVCSHPDAVEINEALVVHHTPNRRIASQYGLVETSIRRHREHIPEMLVKASRAEEVAQADSLLDRIEALQERTEAALEKAEEQENLFAILGAIREMRRNLELIGEVTKELNRTPTVNLHLRPEWLEVKAVILSAVDRHPEILGEIEGAFERAEQLNA
jgi:uncharacterized protein YigA (DUF484 family)